MSRNTELLDKIEKLDALAASTTFPAERETALTKALELRCMLDPNEPDEQGWSEEARSYNRWLNEHLDVEALVMVIRDLKAKAWDDLHWVVPGHGPMLGMRDLFALWTEYFHAGRLDHLG